MTDTTHTNILIIDNDEDVVRAIATRLEHVGHTCATAYSGSQGLSVFNGGTFDLVITDVNMPGGDGVALVASIRAVSTVPIIVVSGFSDEYFAQFEGMPGVSMLRKPFETETLVDLVETDLILTNAGDPA